MAHDVHAAPPTWIRTSRDASAATTGHSVGGRRFAKYGAPRSSSRRSGAASAGHSVHGRHACRRSCLAAGRDTPDTQRRTAAGEGAASVLTEFQRRRCLPPRRLAVNLRRTTSSAIVSTDKTVSVRTILLLSPAPREPNARHRRMSRPDVRAGWVFKQSAVKQARCCTICGRNCPLCLDDLRTA